jgi:hypothetical protein
MTKTTVQSRLARSDGPREIPAKTGDVMVHASFLKRPQEMEVLPLQREGHLASYGYAR